MSVVSKTRKNNAKIYAIILTYDENIIFVDNLLCQINKLWPTANFVYRIPYNDKRPDFLKGKYTESDLEFIRTPTEIKQTILALIKDLQDDDWVFWCIDDKFMIDLKESEVQKINNWIKELQDSNICGVAFARVRRLLNPENIDYKDKINISAGLTLIKRHNFQHQFWMPQFFRVKVLRSVFESFPDDHFQAKMMDTFLETVKLDPSFRFYVTENNLAVFCESASRGEATKSLERSLQYCRIENYAGKNFSNKDIIIGYLVTWRSFSAYFHAFQNRIRRFIERLILV